VWGDVRNTVLVEEVSSQGQSAPRNGNPALSVQPRVPAQGGRGGPAGSVTSEPACTSGQSSFEVVLLACSSISLHLPA
jgi:hypothetical protein